ncbi:adenylate/guanylate cyclase domain-containing protein [Jatrophihabitans endophyticus]|uniref:adenylate/guanylate cyclase domain-containing protein n=1 Tax=Jatrophihabitans endophyticus TaxID=1206085 RepID=UPI0019F3B133|nr:adenylate/guanylate cyclase domain-containing protein [Jatrophihabitans endophyticus]MBE7187958.1 AAA family ATPase [Jatrophihabitans endophyticus]
MQCAACGVINPADGKFCHDCGAPLTARCGSCGTSVGPGQRFCGECGAPLDAAASPHDGVVAIPPTLTERRVCSVLFADLVGFTPLSESRDHEDVRALLSRYFEMARTVIGRYGGTVEKFIGDAVMAVWGAPVAAEGDSERAVRAGLDLVAATAALGREIRADGLALRVGVVTGEVTTTVGAVGEGMVAGDPVNTAARVQSIAEPGSVWVDEATQRRAGVAIAFTAVGEHALKGKVAPQELWRATRVLSNLGGSQRVDGLEAPMIGREAEERTLRELFHATVERRAPRLVMVSGEAGSGKSRLGWEFEKYVDGLAELMWWHRGRCLSYGDGVAFWALAEAVRQRFEIAEEDPPDVAARKLAEGLDEYVPDDEQRRYVGVRLARLLGLGYAHDTGAVLTQDELFAGWRLFFEILAASGPVILMIEDAQHADDALLDFLVHVVEWARHVPIFVVVFGRPEVLERRPDLAAGRNRSSLSLDPLDGRAMREIVHALVRDLPDGGTARIVEQAQGNPLFAIEMIRSLIDRDLIVPVGGAYRMVGQFDALTVSGGLQALLAARLDALDPGLRSLVADASVLGSTFPAEALAAVAGRPAAEVVAGLGELVRREILDVTVDPLSPQRGAYRFGQGLLRQVAYETLSRRDRRARHLLVADHLQRVFAGGGEEVVDVVAQHYLDALAASSGDDDPEVRVRAVECLVRAGERSERIGAPLRAAHLLDQAAQLCADERPDDAAGYWERGASLAGSAVANDDAWQMLARARAIHEAAGRSRDAARTRVQDGRWLLRAGRFEESRATLARALDELRPEPDATTVDGIILAARVASFMRDTAAAFALVHEGLGLAQDLGSPDLVFGHLIAARGTANLVDQRRREAAIDFGLALRLSDLAAHPLEHCSMVINLSAAQLGTDFDAAADSADAAREEALRLGDPMMSAVATANLAVARLNAGRWAEAEAALADGDYVAMEAVELLRTVVRAMRGASVDRDELDARVHSFEGSEDLEERTTAAWTAATVAALDGRSDDVLARLVPVFDAASGPDPDLSMESSYWSWPIAVRAAFDTGRVDVARRLIALLDAPPVGRLAAIARSNLALARARLATVTADPGAPALFEAAIDELRTTGSPFHLAQGLLDAADDGRSRGVEVTALESEAAQIADRLGAAELRGRLGDRQSAP